MGTYYKEVSNHIEDIDNGDILEIGVDRGEGSTAFFADLAKSRNVKFTGVDAHPDQIKNITRALQVNGSLPEHVEFVHAKGEEYLADIADSGREFSLVYLDNFDWDYWKGNGPDEPFVPGQRQMYEEVMGLPMLNINSQVTHMAQAINLLDMLTPNCVVVCDDTWFEQREGIFIGKCSGVVPLLLALDFQIVHNGGYRNQPGGSGVILKRIVEA